MSVQADVVAFSPHYPRELCEKSLRRVRKQVISGGKATAECAPILASLNPE